ncbi:uncharacterized protein LOC123688948 [Harmonia axyridis]|uniref:uncharacterized protein LOC123688948 n=1 Tax=Harmonia axyridis TaxID=115357 RepID=UPI001E276442|nr:uncharacterized protein LOC123688948 [Harmonia axyridis]
MRTLILLGICLQYYFYYAEALDCISCSSTDIYSLCALGVDDTTNVCDDGSLCYQLVKFADKNMKSPTYERGCTLDHSKCPETNNFLTCSLCNNTDSCNNEVLPHPIGIRIKVIQ